MALPTPLTPAQVGGEADVSETPVFFRTGPHAGKMLLVSKTDPNLQSAIDSGDVVADPSLDATPPGAPVPTLISTSPLTATAMTNVLITGTGFRVGHFVDIANVDGENIVIVSDTQITADFDLTGKTPGPYNLQIYYGESSTPLDTLSVTVTAVAPTNSVPPAITGTAQVGQVLTVSNGTWTGSPTFARQWKADGTNIGGATAATYTPVAGDVGKAITVMVTATNAGGSTPITTAPTAAVIAAA